ncbi:MAG: agmatine deiminase family protein [Kiritimatiellia bacterium]|jgi:hypothetical protein|nr:agmatine deiminase family protein [Kiritimatiellia bacterium]
MTSRVLGFLTGLIAALCLAAAQGWWNTRNTEVVLLSDVHGAIQEVCVHYTPAFHSESVETLDDFFSELGTGTMVRVVVETRSDFDFLIEDLRRKGFSPPGNLSPVVTGMPITPWAKDRFGSMFSPRGPVLAVPPLRSMREGPRANDEKVPRILAAHLPGVEFRSLPFFFDGGDLLADEDNIFVAANFIARNQPSNASDRSRLLSLIESEFKKTPIVIGNRISEIPDHHIGMFLTPLGNNAVAVGDPDLGLRLWENTPDTAAEVNISHNEERLVRFRNVARILEEKGFRVIRIPLLLTKQPQVYVSYNNAIVEYARGTKRIFMPTYGIPSLDKFASDSFESEGWRVIPVRVDKVYRHTGSLRCLVGILKRGR